MAVWRFSILCDIYIPLSYNTGIHADFFDKDHRKWMTIDGDIIIIYKGYSWNGCSPKRCIFGKWIGTPDWKETRLASLVHDALCQFFSCNHFLMTKRDVDLIFYHIMNMSNFKLRDIYYGAVNKFGEYSKNDDEYSNEINYETTVCAGIS